MNETVNEYLMKESEFVRTVYSDRAKETRLLEHYSLIAAGLIWSFCATNVELPAFKLLMWVPAIINCLLGLRACATYRIMVITRNYLASIESKVGFPENFGWGTR